MAYVLINDGNDAYRLMKQFEVAGEICVTEEPITPTDRNLILAFLREKREFRDGLVEMVCWNPECSNRIVVTPKQKRDFVISFHKKYGKTVFPCCCRECRDTVIRMFEEE